MELLAALIALDLQPPLCDQSPSMHDQFSEKDVGSTERLVIADTRVTNVQKIVSPLRHPSFSEMPL
jgi:hypothetical protein